MCFHKLGDISLRVANLVLSVTNLKNVKQKFTSRDQVEQRGR